MVLVFCTSHGFGSVATASPILSVTPSLAVGPMRGRPKGPKGPMDFTHGTGTFTSNDDNKKYETIGKKKFSNTQETIGNGLYTISSQLIYVFTNYKFMRSDRLLYILLHI